jgi:uncharacterized membrane protein YecN with MAPEG domain
MAPTLQLPAASRALAAPRRTAAAPPRRRAAPAAALALPDHYGYVALSVGSAALLNQYLAVRVALARREAGVAYPALYAEGTGEAANVFNCTQRAHQNTLEYIPTALACQIVMGLQFPIAAGALGAAWTLGRCAAARFFYARRKYPAAAAACSVSHAPPLSLAAGSFTASGTRLETLRSARLGA